MLYAKTSLNDNSKLNTAASYASELGIKDFYWVFVRTEMNLIVLSKPSNCVNTQYTVLSGAMAKVRKNWVSA